MELTTVTLKAFATLCASKRTGRICQILRRGLISSHPFSYRKCGCVDPNEWIARFVVLPGTNRTIEAPLCIAQDTCYKVAASELANSSSIKDEHCSDCKQGCSSTSYIVTPSAVASPTTEVAEEVRAWVESQGVPLPPNWTTNWETEVENNYVKLEVVCQSPLVENITQQALIGAVEVLSNVGGHTGLWIGISFLSIMEFVEMLYRLVQHQFHAIRRGATVRGATISQ